MNFVAPEVRSLLGTERELLIDLSEHLLRGGAPEAEVREVRIAARGLEETFLLVVVGEFNAGKSSILNALLGAPDGQKVLEEGVTPTTDRVSILVHGPVDKSAPYNPNLESNLNPGDGVDEFVMRRELPFSFLEGVALVDTPGTNAVIRRHQVITEGFLPRADLLLFLTSADRPFTESEKQFLTLAKSWGRKVLLVVNKIDLLEKQSDRDEVRAFVTRNAREVLGLEPPVFLVSVRVHQRANLKAGETGGDPGFNQLQAALRETLTERDRTRLKLLSPLGVASKLIERSVARAKASLEVLREDTRTLSDLDRQLEVHAKDLESDLATHLKGMDGLLDGLEKRGEVYIEDTLRFRKSIELLNTDKVRADFEKTVVKDAPAQLERRVSELIDRFLERNIHFWDTVTSFISNRAATTTDGEARENLIRGARFQYDRQGLLERVGQTAQVQIDGLDREDLSRRLSSGAQSTIIQTGAIGAGGLGLGLLLAALAGPGGILLGLGALGASAFLLPRKRAQAKAELKDRVRETRDRLREVLTREYTLEVERVQVRLRDATSPYTQFIRAESGRLEESQSEANRLLARTAELRSNVESV
jgi:small GTP-binding protein